MSRGIPIIPIEIEMTAIQATASAPKIKLSPHTP